MELWSAEQAMPGLMVCIFSFLPGIPVSFGCFLSEPIRKHWHSQHLVQSCRPAIQSIKNIFWGRAAAYSFRGNFQEWKAVLNLLDHKGWLLLSPCLQTSLGDLRPSCSPSRCNCPDFHFSKKVSMETVQSFSKSENKGMKIKTMGKVSNWCSSF